MNKKVSIITPVYNSAKYINKCIDSVLNQTYSNWELILVNDGSTDQSRSICESYSKKDKRIILVNQENSGVSVARNTGLDYSTGDYIHFLDSDDFLEKNMLERTLDKALENDYDLVIFGSNHLYENGKKMKRPETVMKEEISEKAEIVGNLFVYGGVLWNKLIKADLIFDNNLRFNTKLKASEDMYMTMHLVHYGTRFVYLNDKLYNYLVRENSLTRDDCPEKIVQYDNEAMEGIELCIKYVNENIPECTGLLVNVVMRLQIENIVGLMKYKEARKSHYMVMAGYIDKYRDSLYCTRYMRLYSDLIKINPLFFKWVWKIKNIVKK
ncbi:MAG: glycosyltransferase [Eubacterium sp.]|nr:glycosyltransferase [Eubacterium sp.]